MKMKFRGFLKKGSIKRRSNELAISDPGSDDSWDLLCKDDNQANVLPGLKSARVLIADIASTSSTGNQAGPIVGNAAQRHEVISNLSATETKTANISVESLTNTKKKKKLLPFTSTPFVSHKQVPAFEVSSIISPVDGCSIERPPTTEALNTSGTILVVNRKNVADDTFNQLLNPRKSPRRKSLRELGVRPLKSLINQGDTTRQYAGGALKGRTTISVNPSCYNEESWETTDASPTCTTESKKTSSPDKKTRISQESSAAPQPNSRDRATAKSSRPSDRTNSQDENKAQGTPVEGNDLCNSPRRISRISQSVFTEIPDTQTEDREMDLNPLLNRKSESLQVGEITHKKQKISGSKFSQVEGKNNTLQPEENYPQGGNVGDEVHVTAEDPLNKVDNANKNQISTQNEAIIKSIIINNAQEGKRGQGKRVSFYEGPQQTNLSQENSTLCMKSKNNFSKELEARSLEPDEKEPVVQIHKDEKKKSELKKGNKNTDQDDSVNSQDSNVCASANQVELCTAGLVENNVETQNSLKGSTASVKEVNMVCKSTFSVKIGNTVLTQGSSFGVAVDCQENKSSENNIVENTHVTPACIAGNSNSSKAVAEKEISVKELHAGIRKTSSIQENELIEIESSSEEERKLLRAQSLKLRENQHNSSRNLTSIKILDSGQGGSKSRHNHSPLKSPVKSCVYENRPGSHTSPLKERDTLFSSPQRAESDLPQPSKPDSLNKPDFHDVSVSSCDIFISRQPSDCRGDIEDNFQLEIMSSSEDEQPTTKKLPKQQSLERKMDENPIYSHERQNEDGLSKPSHLRKASRLSLKTKEIRRRRKEKIEEKRRSLGDSSGSDSPSPHTFKKKTRRTGKNIPSSIVRDNKDIEKCKKNLLLDNIVSDKFAESEKSDPQIVVETLPAIPSTKERSNQNSKSEVKQKKPKNKTTQEKKKPKKIKSLQEEPAALMPVSSLDVLQGQGHRNTEIEIDAQLEEESPISLQEKPCSSNENENIVIDLPPHKETTSGLRCSHRNRKPPSMYWLGNRAHNDVISRLDKEGTSQSQKKPAYNERNTGKSKSQKRKIERTSKFDSTKTKRRVKEIEQNPAFTQPNTSLSQSDVERVLVYDHHNATENETGNDTCMPLEIKTTGYVKGYGVKGDQLSLGAGAKFEDQKSRTCNQIFYVLEGKINYQCAQDEKVLTTGSVFIVPKGKTYNIENLGVSTAKLYVTSCSA